MHQTNQNNHIPVLLEQTLEYLQPKAGDSYLDLTAGYGGHATAVLEHTKGGEAVLVDRDQNAITELSRTFAGNPHVQLMHTDFLSASQQLMDENRTFDMILADLGVSSPHLDNANRGFSVRFDGPLDMRMDERQELTAETIVNTYSEADLADLLHTYGEEPKSRRIARLIVENRPIRTTNELAALSERAWPKGKSKVHPATRTFQALRIAVNDELGLLRKALPLWVRLLKPGGRLAVISFHSLEDRIVKQALAADSGERYDASLQLLTKQPAVASEDQTVFNPRARSAKLRAAVKK